MSDQAPLCVDLDGTLLRTDTLFESVLALVKSNPWAVLRMPLSLLRDRAHFKAELGNNIVLQVDSLPLNAELVEHLRQERQCGRRLVLVTGADKRVGEAVAQRLGLFDEVLGSDGLVNLTGKQKAAVLVQRFGQKGFDYAGNARPDLTVWAVARKAILVNAAPGLEVQARAVCDVEKVVPPEPRGLRVWMRAFRVHQWCKNLLLFLPLMGSHRWGDVGTVVALLTAFAAFSLAASSVYVLNDLLDLQSDRHHASKCHRPFASGQLPLTWGIVSVPVLLTASASLAVTLPWSFCAALGIYYLLTLAYSLRIKEAEILDVFVLAGLYAIRVLAGGYAAQIVVSDWLLAFSIFLFLSLAFVKRFTELQAMPEAGAGKVMGRGYCAKDLEVLGSMGVGSGYLSVLVLALYINHPAVTQLYGNPVALWFACPAVLYWISRVWLVAHRGEMHHDPIIFALSDKQSWLIALILLLIGTTAAPK